MESAGGRGHQDEGHTYLSLTHKNMQKMEETSKKKNLVYPVHIKPYFSCHMPQLANNLLKEHSKNLALQKMVTLVVSVVLLLSMAQLVDGVIMTYMSKFCSAACITASQNLTIVAATETCCTSDLCNNEKLGDVNSQYLGSGGGVLAGGTFLLIAVSGLLSAISAM
ncbi:uncharacterized protein LOC143783099 isoform X2 [Ranitomeya variabilis]|uniref:uncharacterized protein LOC143783099 isoform X2 n=1 Tax=Ranitomeya variabilis TaxID=490064 RepID=UPI004056FAD5